MKIDEWGRVIFNNDEIIDFLFFDKDITSLCVDDTSEIEIYNQNCRKFNKLDFIINPIKELTINPNEYHLQRQKKWFIPEEYSKIDVRKKLLDLCIEQKEIDRVNIEMNKFEERDMIPILQLMFYLVDYWREKGIVWGVGRGSSVASYCLFLIGIHRINSLFYELPIEEFLK